MRRGSRVLAAMVVLGAASSARAQVPFDQNIDVQTFRLAPGPHNFLTVAGARVEGSGAFSLGVWANYGNGALTIFDADCPNVDNDTGCAAGAVRSRPVQHLATLNAIAAVSIARRLLLSLDLPLMFTVGDAVDPVTFRPVGGEANPQRRSTFALGDPRVEAKVRVAGEGVRGAAFALSAWATIPTGRYTGGDQRFVADQTVSFGARAIGDFRYGRFLGAVNLGAVIRPEGATLLSTTVGTRMLWGAAAGVELTPRVQVFAEFAGSTDFSAQVQSNTVEADLAARYRAGAVALTLGGGAGLVRGAGAPAGRGFVGLVWSPNRADADRDGVPDEVDRCPTEAEDLDRYEDLDGCPEADNDGDGVDDINDRCPDAAEDRDQFQDNDGCPDDDNDNDGVPDGFDSCPREPEDRDGDRDNDGCPDVDRDRDGVPDDRDACPTEPEEFDGYRDDDGCPDPDNDGDGILDAEDRCSDQPETVNGVDDTDGCPDTVEAPPSEPASPTASTGASSSGGGALAELVGDRIRIVSEVAFARGSDRIVGAASFRTLDAVVAVLTAHPEVRRVEIQGHTDNDGRASANRALSQRRADMVRTYLTGHGVAAERLTARGYGPDRPIESNASSAGRARNRRVDFVVATP